MCLCPPVGSSHIRLALTCPQAEAEGDTGQKQREGKHFQPWWPGVWRPTTLGLGWPTLLGSASP